MIELDNVQPVGIFDRLKPCPFCGSKPEITKIIIRFTPEKEYGYKVVCGNIQCHILSETELCLSEEEAINLWNRRADNA